MLTGGAPGSIAGGIKITTVFVVLVVLTRKTDSEGDIKVFHHRLLARTIHKAVVYTLKAIALLVICVGMLTVIEEPFSDNIESIVFEVVSAFGTVGLSLGLTPVLPVAGKWVIISVMFAGRVGLIALAVPGLLHRDDNITYPEGSIMLE
jgi:trk system potassium uptake protein TrkH